MVSKVNLKARINRHSRILKNNLGTIHPFRTLYYRWNYNIVFFLVIFLFPVYPLFSAFVTDTTQYSFSRSEVDESSIIDSYQEGENTSTEIITSTDSSVDEEQDLGTVFEDNTFLSLNSIMEASQRDVSNHTEVIKYEVKAGDSFSTIAYKFGISKNSIYRANDFSTSKILQPGEEIKIPPVSGIIYTVEKGDTLSSIAKEYGIDQEKIIIQNGLTIDSNLIAGNDLIIPGAVKKIETPVVAPVQTYAAATTTTSTTTVLSSTTTSGEYQLVKRTPLRKFYWGNCTRFVAQYKNVDWNGNAKDWLRNAKANGYPTGTTPTKGSIIVFFGKGYNPYYGHVGIVVNVTSTEVIIKDMNYLKLNQVTTRKVAINDPAILGYIYVD